MEKTEQNEARKKTKETRTALQRCDAELALRYRVIKRPPPAGRRRRGEAAGKPGPPSWIWGTKFVFFDRRKGEFGEAVRNNTTGIFYTKMAKLYKLKYEDMAEDEDFAVDFEDPPDEAANVVVNLRLAPDVLRKRQQEHTAVRTVSVGCSH